MPAIDPPVGLSQEFVQMLIGKYVVGAPGFIYAKPAVRCGWSIVMLPLHIYVRLLEHKHWYTIVVSHVVSVTRVGTVKSLSNSIFTVLMSMPGRNSPGVSPFQTSMHGMHCHSDAILSPAMLPSLKL